MQYLPLYHCINTVGSLRLLNSYFHISFHSSIVLFAVFAYVLLSDKYTFF